MGIFGRGKDRRQHERVATAGTHSMLGDVLDLSETGAKLFAKGTPGCEVGDEIEIDIAQDSTEMHVMAKVVRIGELGFKRYEIGVEFVGIGPAEQAVIRVLQRPGITEQVCPRAYRAA